MEHLEIRYSNPCKVFVSEIHRQKRSRRLSENKQKEVQQRICFQNNHFILWGTQLGTILPPRELQRSFRNLLEQQSNPLQKYISSNKPF